MNSPDPRDYGDMREYENDVADWEAHQESERDREREEAYWDAKHDLMKDERKE